MTLEHLLESCQKASVKDLYSLQTSLQSLHKFLQQQKQEENEEIRSDDDEQILHNIKSLLKLQVVRTESSSEILRQIYGLVDACLDMYAGPYMTVLASLQCLQEYEYQQEQVSNSSAGNNIYEITTTPDISNHHSSRSALLASLDCIKKYFATFAAVPQPSDYFCKGGENFILSLLFDFYTKQKTNNNSNCTNSRTKSFVQKHNNENYIHQLVQLTIRLPTLISSACYKAQLSLPKWSIHTYYLSRILIFFTTMTFSFVQKNDTNQLATGNDGHNNEEDIKYHDTIKAISTSYYQNLIQSLIHHGSSDEIANCFYQFWSKSQHSQIQYSSNHQHQVTNTAISSCTSNQNNYHRFMGNIFHSIAKQQSPRDCVTLLRSMMKCCTSLQNLEIYPSTSTSTTSLMNKVTKKQRKDIDVICHRECLSFLLDTCLPYLESSSLICELLVKDFILSSKFVSSIIHSDQQRLICRCLVILLSKVKLTMQDDVNEDFDYESDDDYTFPSNQQKKVSSSYDTTDTNTLILLKHLSLVISYWRESVFIHETDTIHQRHVTNFILDSLDYISQNETSYNINMNTNNATTTSDNSGDHSIYQFILPDLVGGVSNRLKMSSESIRIDGLIIAEEIGPLLGQSLRFDELDKIRDDDQTNDVISSKSATSIMNSGTYSASLSSPKQLHDDLKKKVPRRRPNEKKMKTIIDPDEEYKSDDDECNISDIASFESNSDSNVAYDSDSDWGEDELLPHGIQDDESDLQVARKPIYLKECLEYLRADGNDHETHCKHLVAIQELPSLVRSLPSDLPDMVLILLKQVVHMENKFDIENFAQYRWESLCALGSCQPNESMPFLIDEIFGDVSLGLRLEVLNVLSYCSSELCGTLELERSRDLNQRKISECKGDIKIMGKRSLITDEQITTKNKPNSISKTRRWGRCGRPITKQITVINHFKEIAPMCFYTLLKRFMECKHIETLWGGENGSRLLSSLLITLCTFVENSGVYYSSNMSSCTSVMAMDLFELSWTFHDATFVEIRVAVLIVLANCVTCLPREYVVQVMQDKEKVFDILKRIKSFDNDGGCRNLAKHILDHMSFDARALLLEEINNI